MPLAGDRPRVVTLPKERPDKRRQYPPARSPSRGGRGCRTGTAPSVSAKPHHKTKVRHKAAKRRKATRHEASADKKKRRRHARHHRKKRHYKHQAQAP